MLADLYRGAFRRLGGKGLGLGLFNRVHRLVWQNWLQPEAVDVLGFRLTLPKDDTGMSQVLQMGQLFEPEMVERFQRVVRPGMVVLDIGANLGYYTLLASKLAGPGGKVLAFEPELTNLSFLMKNIAQNACVNVFVCPCAVSDAFGELTLYLSYPSRSGHSIIRPDDGASRSQRVGAVSLDEYVAPLEPNVVKIDIEGAEALALRGMKRMVGNPALEAVFIECNRDALLKRGSSADEVLKPLRAAGFAAEDIDGVNFLCTRPRKPA
jgi:FkbM family methyltransferase